EPVTTLVVLHSVARSSEGDRSRRRKLNPLRCSACSVSIGQYPRFIDAQILIAAYEPAKNDKAVCRRNVCTGKIPSARWRRIRWLQLHPSRRAAKAVGIGQDPGIISIGTREVRVRAAE